MAVLKTGYQKVTINTDGTLITELVPSPTIDTSTFATKADLDKVKQDLTITNLLTFPDTYFKSTVGSTANSYTVTLSDSLIAKFADFESRIKALESGSTTPPVVTPPSTTLSLNNALIIADGNSLTAGGETIPYTEILKTKAPFTTNGAVIKNFAVGGQTTTQMMADAATQIDVLFNKNITNIIIAYEIGNDIYYNGNVTVAQDNFKKYCLDRKAVGFKVIVMTCTPRDQVAGTGETSAVFNTKLQQANTWLRANYTSFSDGLVDLAADTRLQDTTSKYFVADKVHYSNEGHAVVAELVYTKLMNYTNTTIPVPPTTGKPSTPVFTATTSDVTNWLEATHPQFPNELEFSYNGGVTWYGYGGGGNVGNVNLPEGYYLFRVKAATNRPASDILRSPAYTAK